jgi:hypothetical protein
MPIDTNGRTRNITDKIFSRLRRQKYPPDTKIIEIPVLSFSLSLSLSLSEVQNVGVPIK